jgi:hypothetical protein
VSHRPVRTALIVASLAAVLASATAFAKTTSPAIYLTWTGNHGDVVAQLDPALDAGWSSGDGVTDGTFGVAVYWPGQHIRSAHLQRNFGNGDWGAWAGNAYYWGLGLSATPNGALLNNTDSSFDVATDSRGWAAFFLHADNYAARSDSQFRVADRFQLELCTGPDMSGECVLSPWITIRGS